MFAPSLVIPLCEYYKISTWNKLSLIDYKDLFRQFFVESTAIIVSDEGKYRVQSLHYSTSFLSWIALFIGDIYNNLYSSVISRLFVSEKLKDIPSDIIINPVGGTKQLSFIHLVNVLNLLDDAVDIFKEHILLIHRDLYVYSYEIIKNETESISEFFDL